MCINAEKLAWLGSKRENKCLPNSQPETSTLIAFFLLDDFFHFQVCFGRVFDKLDGRCIGRGVDTFKCATCGGTHLPELWRNTSSNSHFKAGNKVYHPLQQDHTIPYHTHFHILFIMALLSVVGETKGII